MAVIKPFSIGVLWSLRLVHRFVPNYGVVLLLFSIVVKLLVWPLTQKSYVSMKRMQLLQPKMKALQEKHKGNAQKLQQEMGALYKEHKVNPIGGCLPTVLQMPLLYALFIVFRTTIELRGAPFVLWIKDLSMPDVLFQLPFTIPFYGDHVCVLPLIMALSTFLQSKSTMTDPNQKAMLYMMPLMFIFLFNNFPSGLTLYYTLFNLLSWGQQKMMKVHDPKIEKTLETLKQEQERAARKKDDPGRRREHRSSISRYRILLTLDFRANEGSISLLNFSSFPHSVIVIAKKKPLIQWLSMQCMLLSCVIILPLL